MIEIQINDAAIWQAFSRLEGSLSDLSLVMNDIGDNLVRSTQDRMVAGVTPDGTPFAPRSEATLAQYQRKGLTPGPHPLDLTSTMRGGIHHSYGADHVSVGSGAIQAAVMQLGAAKGEFGTMSNGASIPWGDIPARPFLGVSEEDHADIMAILAEAFEEAWDQ